MENLLKKSNKLPLTIREVNSTQKIIKKTDKHQYLCGVDWVEFTGKMELINIDEIKSFMFHHTNTNRGTQFFKNLYQINTIYDGEDINFCTLETTPRVSFIPVDIVKIKLNNQYCYHSKYLDLLKIFIENYKITFKNYTRIDVFIDFQKINKFNYDIQKFYKYLANKKLTIKNKQKTTIYNNSDPFSNKKSIEKDHHLYNIFYNGNFINGLSFGSRSSGVYVSTYCKSLEIEKKSHKPYIIENWKNLNFNLDLPVYRVEVSMKKNVIDIVNDEGETIGNYNDINFLQNLQPFLIHQIKTHFSLTFNTNKDITRRKKYTPFNLQKCDTKNIIWCEKPISSNYTKSYIKRLTTDAIFYQKENNRILAHYLFEHAQKLVDRYNLHKWFYNKLDYLGLELLYLNKIQIQDIEKLQIKQLLQTSLNLN